MQSTEDRQKRMVSVKLDPSTVKNLDALAAKVGIPRGRMAVRIIHESLPEIKVLNKIGVLRWGSWLEWIVRKVQTKMKMLESQNSDQKKISVTLWLDEKDVETLTTIGNKFLLTKSKFASNIITAITPEVKFIDSLGVVDLVYWLEGIKKNVEEKSFEKLRQKGIIK